MASTDLDLPQLFEAADLTSAKGQRKVLRATASQLALLTLAAAGGAFSLRSGTSVDWAALVGGAAFVLAALIRLNVLTSRPDQAWYVGRAAAESIKTLAWRYAVGGDPFGLGEGPDADRAFIERVRELLQDLKGIQLASTDERPGQITADMRELRARPLDARKNAYEDRRIHDQQQWYSTKAERNRKSAGAWNAVTLTLEAAGATGAFLRAADVVAIDLLGLAGAAVAALTAWMQTKQYDNLASAYALAAHELTSIRSLIDLPMDEGEWAAFVAQAEEAISREHTTWRASRS